MTFPTCLAMTDAELQKVVPDCCIARMGCRFSLLDTDLSQVPQSLPKDAILILDDGVPIHGSDPEAVCQSLQQLAETLQPAGILLDFQRKGSPETEQMVKKILKCAPCPVLVSEAYASGKDCPVFLASPPLHKPLKAYLSPWSGREIWLEIAPETQEMFLTKDGCCITHLPENNWTLPLHDDALHCHYAIKTGENWAKFVLSRDFEDLRSLAEEAHCLGVKGTIGLYQIFCSFPDMLPQPRQVSPEDSDTAQE